MITLDNYTLISIIIICIFAIIANVLVSTNHQREQIERFKYEQDLKEKHYLRQQGLLPQNPLKVKERFFDDEN